MRFLAAMGRWLSISCLVDLGELSPSHRVWLTGIEDGEGGLTLHYEFVPAVQPEEIRNARGGFHWKLRVRDDLGNEHALGDTGTLDLDGDRPTSHGLRRIGRVPAEATKLFLTFVPARGVAADPHQAVVDLRSRSLSLP